MSSIEQALTSLDSWVREQQHTHQMPGVAICVRSNDEVVTKTYGVRDIESGQALQDNFLFHIFSQTKTFTAVAILQLVEQDKLKLDAKLVDLLPEFRDLFDRPELKVLKDGKLEPISLRDALSHKTRLVPGFRSDAPTDPTREDLLHFPISEKMFSPKNAYSNSMYALLGVLVENASKETYADYVKNHIIDKYDLGEIYIHLADVPEKERGRIPVGYVDGKKAPTTENMETISAAGAFYATPQALSQFFHKLANHEILPKELMDQMFSSIHPNVFGPEDERAYGLGALCYPSETGNLWGHTGAGRLNGHRVATLHSPELNLTVSVMQTRIEHDSVVGNNRQRSADQQFDCAAIIKKVVASVKAAGLDAITGPPRPAGHPSTPRVRARKHTKG